MEYLNQQQRRQALNWYINSNRDLGSIAQHFGMTREQLTEQLKKQVDAKELRRCL